MQKHAPSTEAEMLLITTPDSPYWLLQLDMDADSRKIQGAFRNFFRKNPKKGVKVGKSAQNKLLNAKERAKADAFCVQSPSPRIDMSTINKAIEEDEVAMKADLYPEPIEFSDLHFPHKIPRRTIPPLETETLTYRNEFSFETKS